MNFHLLTDAFQVLEVARRPASFDDITDTGRLHYRFCQANFVEHRRDLPARCGDIHVLPEVVDPDMGCLKWTQAGGFSAATTIHSNAMDKLP